MEKLSAYLSLSTFYDVFSAKKKPLEFTDKREYCFNKKQNIPNLIKKKKTHPF